MYQKARAGNTDELHVVPTRDDLRHYDKVDSDHTNPQYLTGNSSGRNGLKSKNDQDRMHAMEAKLNKEIKVAQKVLDDNDDVQLMFSDDEEGSKKTRGGKVDYNATKAILKKYKGREEEGEKEGSTEKSKKEHFKNEPSEENDLPAADMIIKKYPNTKKKKKNKDVASNEQQSGNDENGLQDSYDPKTSHNQTASDANVKREDHVRPGSVASNDRNVHAGSGTRPSSAANVKHIQKDEPPEDPRHHEADVEYDGFDSDEEAKLKTKRENIQPVSRAIFGGKYEKGATVDPTESKSQRSGGKLGSLSNVQHEKSSSESTSSNSAKERRVSRQDTFDKSPKNRSTSSHITSTSSTLDAKRAPSGKAKEPERSSSTLSNESKKKSPKLPTPKKNPHMDALVSSEDETTEESNKDPDEILEEYLREHQQKKDAKKKNNKTAD